MKHIFLLITTVFLFYHSLLQAQQLGTVTSNIKIDQFGYFPSSRKIAVIAKPVVGYNVAAEGGFTPSTGTGQYKVMRWSDNTEMLSGTLVQWTDPNTNALTHAQSGDAGWWFDFTGVTAPGSYYIYDVGRNVRSYRFEIGNDVYTEILEQAVRMYFYQRINFAKTTPYVDAKWADAACFERANQDRAARLYTAKTDASTARDLHGGWMDAGDYNKYTTFTFRTVGSLLETYRLAPTVFTDNSNIPESLNGIPDLLDEIMWELDWLKRMQDATGTSGLFLKVGVDTYNNIGTPASADANPRYYVGECTSATITGAALFASASIVYKSLGKTAMTTYGEDLLTRAKAAWTRVKMLTNGFTLGSFNTSCDDGTIKSGDADLDANTQYDIALTAAVYLYEATGDADYKTFFESNYTKAQPYNSSNQWYAFTPYHTVPQRAMLRYARLAGVNATVASNITYRKSINNIAGISSYTNKTDLYRSHFLDSDYGWGSNEYKANAGIHNFDFIHFNINTTNHAEYREVGESYLHYFHGVTPIGKTMLSNMYDYGGDNCMNEIYHTWFRDGTNWDNALTSLYGPPPGYVICGVNKNYPITTLSPPYGQPVQKSFRDNWNPITDAEKSWVIMEPTIYGQAAYIGLLARVMSSNPNVILPLHFTNFIVNPTPTGVIINWAISEIDHLQYFVVEKSLDGRLFTNLQQVAVEANKLNYSIIDVEPKDKSQTVYYRIKAVYTTEVKFSSIKKIGAQTSHPFTVSPNPANTFIWVNGNIKNESSLTVEVLNVSGIVLQKEQWKQPAGEFSKFVSIEKLPAGTYWIRMQTPEGVKTEKIIKR